MSKKPTIKTIAQIAGVSHVTVSRALRGYSDISKATTQKIQQIAKDIGYTPNAFARSLSSKQSNILGMIVPALGNDTAYNDVFNAVSACAAREGLSVLLGSCNRNLSLEMNYCKNMCENRVGALIISPITSDVSHIKEICKDIVPVIFLGGKTGLEEDYCITIDYQNSAKIAVSHLYHLGHRDIALFLYSPNNKTIEQKMIGYEEAMNAYQLPTRIYWEGDSSDTLKAGTKLTERLILENNLPSAIWCASDLMAVGVINALSKYNLKVPSDVSVIGHDNLFFSDLNFISLTTFTLPKQEIGKKAVEMALELMHYNKDNNEPKPYCKSIFQAELLQRNSTGIWDKH
ncbi:MAG: LacI family DNA-binding transcriptional regulator [Lachnospiraceae bacterium]|nr:LacI family DNA-binding transcriptional regulator [Lachnospiraceae bacterium]